MIADNLQDIHRQVHETALSCGRDPGKIRILAVSKTRETKDILEAYQCGQSLFGENYLQEARGKISSITQKGIRWHFIGHLQSNKAQEAVELFDMIETVDRFKIAQALNKYASQRNRILDILIQVNIGKEAQKSGIQAEGASDLIRRIAQLPHLKVRGLMTLPPYSDNPEDSRPYFRELATLARNLSAQRLLGTMEEIELSMGMSGDFKVAVEEGATLVRLGTALFGSRSR